jgi:circadian clock protein KaiC
MSDAAGAGLAPTGIEGLDDVLGGGLPRNRLHLIQGDPGSGKTTAALQFLLQGMGSGEGGLYVTLSETAEELIGVARSHGWSLEGVTIHELTPGDEATKGDYTLFHPSEVELGKTTQAVLETVERVKPQRVVFDSLSEMRLLARDALRYRRQILALKQFFVGRSCTVLLLDDRTSDTSDVQLESLAHGVIDFEQLAPEYGAERRRLRVKKMRARSFRGGYHDFRIATGGLRVFPRLVAAEHHQEFAGEAVASGVEELDLLLGGGLDRGSSTLILGPAGSGKTSIALRFALTAAERGQRATAYAFEEGLLTLTARMRGLGWSLAPHIETGRLRLQQVDPAELTPGEFAHEVRRTVEQEGTRVVVIDSLNGYLNAMPQERHLALHLHELLSYLNQLGVATVMVMTQHGMPGAGISTSVDLSYLADTVLLLRYFENAGALHVAGSVLKKRGGNHERTLRELRFGPDGIKVGPPLSEFRGVLTGVPVLAGGGDTPMKATP